MSTRKQDSFRQHMMLGTLNPHIPPQTGWEPYDATSRIPCPKCGKMVKLEGERPEQHYASLSSYICY
jgi:hypothetical protein